MCWQHAEDKFTYKVSPLDRECTKRSLLSDLARIYDPLGFLAPLTFFAKHLMQRLWTLGLQWDDSPPANISDLWSQYKTQLPSLSQLSIPRRIVPSSYLSCEIHGFADSSEKGYAAVVYMRFQLTNGSYNAELICAKTKVAPLRRVSLPRLELCAAVLLSDVMKLVLDNYSGLLNISQSYAWSDSMTALAWIKSSPHRWKTFVSNRVSYIQETLSPDVFRYVPSGDNPADCASRGLLPNDLLAHDTWWSGPKWLHQSESSWPQVATTQVTNDEERAVVLIATDSSNHFDSLLEKFSSIRKITRIVAYVSHFISCLRDPTKRVAAYLNEQHLYRALLLVVGHVQRAAFAGEMRKLKSGQRLPKSFRKLNPFLDNGLLRVGGRLSHSDLSYDRKYPALLPSKHRLTELLIRDFHNRYLHPGLQTLQFLLSQQFWILSPKRAIQRVVSNCVRCFRARPRASIPLMGDLPAARVNQIKAFSCAGVDYGGPFTITMGRGRAIRSQKAYLCLFVCFATKALHLELVSDLTSEAFLAALRRFVARRGRCSQLFSDCGTNFVGAHKILINHMQSASKTEGISWAFNPPSAPHFGGLWEAGIKSVKTHLNRIIGDQVLTYEEFYTVLVQIEALLNSRPLCALSSDPNDISALTPGHFLTVETLTAVPDTDLGHLKLNRLNRWQLLQRLHQDFWKRWHTEYLHTLQQRPKWTDSAQPLKRGALVLISNELLPPLQWPLGRVVDVHPGSDGIVRVVTVKTSRGILKRPVAKLCPLPSQ